MKFQVAGTNSCATLSKYSLITKGYCQDNFLKYFVPKQDESSLKKPPTRAPIINRGYYVRFKAIEFALQKALFPNKFNIIISLGSGFDTSPLRYRGHFFIEIDFPSVCQEKSRIIKQHGLIDNIEQDEFQCLYLTSSNYLLIGADLRKPTELIKLLMSLKIKINELIEKCCRNLDHEGINWILFNECSLCYIEQHITHELIRLLVNAFENHFITFSSSNPTITYLGYEMLASKHCQNDFGRFLLKHFESLGAPILTFINEDQIQNRFRQLNFEKIEIINMKHFCRDILNLDSNERERIKNLEPFDEWEELDNVCSSYSLTICNKKATKFSHLQPEKNWKIFSDEENSEKNKCCSSSQLISLFGHCSQFDSNQNCIQIFGGFGFEPNESYKIKGELKSVQNSGHRRLKNILELTLNDNCDTITKVNVIKSKNVDSIINRVHCKVVQIDHNHSFLSGGRTSPSKSMFNTILKVDHHSNEFEFIKCFDYPYKTYRHVCSRFGHHSDQIIQFGGKSHIPQSSIFIFDINSGQWSSRNFNKLQIDRHSLASSIFGSNSILLNGGLDLEDNFISTNHLELLDYRDSDLKQFEIKNLDQRLYSHQMKVFSEDQIFLIGGIGSKIISNTVYQIDFRNLNVLKNYRLSSEMDQMLLLQNFSCEFIERDKLWILSGGGNCFSFGTHFNPVLMYKL